MTQVRNRRAIALFALLAVFALIVALAPQAATAHPEGKGDQGGHHIQADDRSNTAGRYSRSFDVEVLGHADPGGFNADVVAHGDHAYMGSWGNPLGNFEAGELSGDAPFCPNLGVRVFDISDPNDPELVSTFADGDDGAGLEGSWTEKVIVEDVDTADFTGTLAAVSAQICNVQEDVDNLGGFALYDVTDPENPELLSTVESLIDGPADGSHEIWLESRDGEAYVYTAEILQEFWTGDPEPDFTADPPIIPTEPGTPDMRIFDVSDPTAPEWIGDWGVWQDEEIFPLAPDDDGIPRTRFVHSLIVSAETAYLSYWDRGTVILDVADPSNPTFVSSVDIPTEGLWSRGNMHSSWVADGGDLLIEAPEVFDPTPDAGSNQEFAFGYPRFTDISDPDNPEVVGGFRMNSTHRRPASLPHGFWTTHDPKVRPGLPGDDNLVYFSWYAEGVVVVDIDAVIEASDPGAGVVAREGDALVAQFVPEPAEDPFGFPGFAPPGVEFPSVWGVFLHEVNGQDIVLASDINSGLWIFELDDRPGRSPAR